MDLAVVQDDVDKNVSSALIHSWIMMMIRKWLLPRIKRGIISMYMCWFLRQLPFVRGPMMFRHVRCYYYFDVVVAVVVVVQDPRIA
jgi:hypothetical protein